MKSKKDLYLCSTIQNKKIKIMKKLSVIFIAISLILTSCSTTKGLKTSDIATDVSGNKVLEVRVVAKRGNASLVQFKGLNGQFVVKNCTWVKGQLVTVNFTNKNIAIR